MGGVVGKKKQKVVGVDTDWPEAAKQARQVGRLSMIVSAMRPSGRRVKTDEGSPGPSAWSKIFANKARVAAVPQSEILPGLSEQEEEKQAREGEESLRLTTDVFDDDDPDGKLKYDVEYIEGESEDPCLICKMYKRDVVFLCRVCGRSYHHGCLIGRGLGLDTNSSRAMENADTDIGWSCPDCETLSELLSLDSTSNLMIKFDNYDTDGDSVINLSNYMEYEVTKYEQDHNDCMPGSKVRECEEMFRAYDRDSDGAVSWGDYSMLEAVKILQRQPRRKLLEYLKPKEIAKLKKYFRMADKRNTGLVTVGESEQAYRSWLRALGLHETEEMMRSFEKSSWSDDCNKMITWERFVRTKALALITSRPNTITIKPYVTSREETAI